jgi:hypothetical protein
MLWHASFLLLSLLLSLLASQMQKYKYYEAGMPNTVASALLLRPQQLARFCQLLQRFPPSEAAARSASASVFVLLY